MSQEIEDALNEFRLDIASERSEDSFDIHDNDTEDSDGDIIRPGIECRRIISNDSESDEDEWSENDKDICLEGYQRTSGVNIIPKNKESVLDVMQLFLENDLFELFTTETNRYHIQVSHKYKEYKIAKWTDVTIQEMKKFMDLLILMGQVRKGTLYDYWSTSPYIQTPILMIAKSDGG
ncbi:uncharacterized protein LOC119632390 [Glossina fuscipes]|uniref:Uncharacterized protein LOC119632390 n=1 Tax=Glossina fuscipes TaxID=7396 RepID=A0A8U0W7F7_9MUSC|nr:uncharacterized protein LOC119632390 [Glossina fuscipes]